MCGTVYGDMHLKDLLGSFVRVGYRIAVPDFYRASRPSQGTVNGGAVSK